MTRAQIIERSKEADRRFQEGLKNSDGGGDMVKEIKPKRKSRRRNRRRRNELRTSND